MREIKFRAWDKDLGAMLPVNQWDFRFPAPAPVMQYTGLKDKNGKEIYEGDIVQTIRKTTTKDGKPNGSIRKRKAVSWRKYGFNLGSSERYEVIGNIYESPNPIEQEA